MYAKLEGLAQVFRRLLQRDARGANHDSAIIPVKSDDVADCAFQLKATMSISVTPKAGQSEGGHVVGGESGKEAKVNDEARR